jgi:hypothetical protein
LRHFTAAIGRNQRYNIETNEKGTLKATEHAKYAGLVSLSLFMGMGKHITADAA